MMKERLATLDEAVKKAEVIKGLDAMTQQWIDGISDCIGAIIEDDPDTFEAVLSELVRIAATNNKKEEENE